MLRKVALLGLSNTGKTDILSDIIGQKLNKTNSITKKTIEFATKTNNEIISITGIPSIYMKDENTEEITEILKETDVIAVVTDIDNIKKTLEWLPKIKKRNIVVILNSKNDTNTKSVKDYNIKKLQKQFKYKFIIKTEEKIKNILFSLLNNTEVKGAKVSKNIEGKLKKCENKITAKKKNIITKKIDQYACNSIFSPIILLSVIICLFAGTIYMGDYLEHKIEYIGIFFSDNIVNLFEYNALTYFLRTIVLSLVSVLMYTPKIALLIFFISILYQSKYMNRINLIIGYKLHKFGLSKEAVLPLISGLTCSIPAYMITDKIKNKIERFITMSSINFLICNGKSITMIFIANILFPKNQALLLIVFIYILSISISLASAKINSIIFKHKGEKIKIDKETLINTLPSYEIPNLRKILKETYVQIKIFLSKAKSILLVSLFLITISNVPYNPFDYKYWGMYKKLENTAIQKEYMLKNSVLGFGANIVTPALKPLGFDWKLTTSILSSMPAKEYTLSALSILYRTEDGESLRQSIKKQMNPKVGIIYLIFLSLWSPCIPAINLFIKKSHNKKDAILFVLYSSIVAYLVALICKLIIM